MNCPTCHSEVSDDARFCGICGCAICKDGESEQSSNLALASPGKADNESKSAAEKIREQAMAPHFKGDPFVGKVLNKRFLVENKLGEGGFGAVYQGVQIGTGRKVAIKVLHPEMTRDKKVLARFRREGQVLCSLRDAHTITTYDFEQSEEGTLFIAMELLLGKSMHDVFRKEAPVEWQRMFKLAAQMCSSLSEAHSIGIVHRDLKPENIYLEERPGVPEFIKILDFGIAKVMRGDSKSDKNLPQLTATGQTLGTLEYMSPEQLMGRELDGRSDVYAVGVLCYEMITGRLPFPDATGPAELISAQLRQAPSAPSQAVPKIKLPPLVDEVILKCLEKDKKDRYADMTELKAVLDVALASGSQAGPMVETKSAKEASNLVETEDDSNTTDSLHTWSESRATEIIVKSLRSKNPTVLWVIIAVVVVSAGMIVFFALL